MTETGAPGPSEGQPRLIQLLSDDFLARRARKGDRRAFEAIYRRYHQDLYRFCLAMVGNPQDAQDALQNTMVKALRALPGEERHVRLKPWLYRVARNEAVETLRRRRDSAAIEPEHPASGLELAETAEARERLRKLIADLAELPERQRAVLMMRELSGFGFEQIADVFDTSPAAARQAVYEARLSLRQMEAGREMGCKEVTWELSEADGRARRRRDIQAHLRSCAECRSFRDAIVRRRGELGALAPLPLAASAGLLEAVLTVGGGKAGGGLAATAGAGAGKAVATSAIAKSAATVAVVGAIGVTAADRSNLVDTPLPGGSEESSRPIPAPSAAEDASRGTSAVSAPSPGPGGETPQSAAPQRRGEGGSEKSDVSSQSQRSSAAPAESVAEDGSPPSSATPPQANGKGPPDELPAASSRGQQTAAANKDKSEPQGKGPPSSLPPQSNAANGGAKPASPPGQAKSDERTQPSGQVAPDNEHPQPFQPSGPPSDHGPPPDAGGKPSKEAG